jgi:hypothetical protein
VGKSKIGSWIVPIVAGIFLVSAISSITEVSATGAGGRTSFTASFSDDPDVAVTPMGISKIGASAAAVGAVAPVEVAWDVPALRSTLNRNNYAYRFKLEEKKANSFQLNENLKIEVYGDNGWATTLLATLYTQQAAVDDSKVEGVIVTIDLGSTTSAPDRFDIVVSRQ